MQHNRYQKDKGQALVRTGAKTTHLQSLAPLGDDRFHQLIRSASAFFATAERDEVTERANAIRDIRRLMADHGLTVADLMD
jgi:acyl-CoA reductase-like NAD-dependent aldehyde dehydrogenase